MTSDLKSLVEAQKTLLGIHDWPRASNGELSWSNALDIDGVTVEGLRVRVEANEFLPDEAVRVQLEYRPHRRRHEPLVRIEWRPLKEHNNKGRGPLQLRFRPFRDTHIHPFKLNWVESERRMLVSNLPVAIPISDFENYNEFIDFCAKRLNIENLKEVPVPPWNPRML